jgi:hypothetical protein
MKEMGKLYCFTRSIQKVHEKLFWRHWGLSGRILFG